MSVSLFSSAVRLSEVQTFSKMLLKRF